MNRWLLYYKYYLSKASDCFTNNDGLFWHYVHRYTICRYIAIKKCNDYKDELWKNN